MSYCVVCVGGRDVDYNWQIETLPKTFKDAQWFFLGINEKKRFDRLKDTDMDARFVLVQVTENRGHHLGAYDGFKETYEIVNQGDFDFSIAIHTDQYFYSSDYVLKKMWLLDDYYVFAGIPRHWMWENDHTLNKAHQHSKLTLPFYTNLMLFNQKWEKSVGFWEGMDDESDKHLESKVGDRFYDLGIDLTKRGVFLEDIEELRNICKDKWYFNRRFPKTDSVHYHGG